MKQMVNEPHKRREHYSGSYPRRYEEKYKELHPEQYSDTVQKVIEKGSTPAGMHIPICVHEILDVLQIQPGMRGLDATLGYGGHTGYMLNALQGSGHLTALDADPIEIVKTEARLREAGFGPEILTVRNINFAELDRIAAENGPFDFVLADLGVSSMQIDNPERGFSYKTDGPLDLRFDPTKGVSAAERLHELSREELQGMLIDNADEPYAEQIAETIVRMFRRGTAIETTADLRGAIGNALSFLPEAERREETKKACQRAFQALRIDVNSEFEVLYAFLEKLPGALAPGGRAAILTFHSGEDRLVKKSFAELYKTGTYSAISKDVIRPSAEECFRNPRAHSTKLRWAEKST